MKISAKDTFDEPVTEEILKQAIERGKNKRLLELNVKNVGYLASDKTLRIGFSDGSAVIFPVQNYPELAALNDIELAEVELGFGGKAICFEENNLHISITGLFASSIPLSKIASSISGFNHGKQVSETKAYAARENGKKGGRPRKPKLEFA